MDTDKTAIRRAQPGDAPAIVRLSAQLGYSMTEQQARSRIEAIESLPGQAVFVAEAGGEVVGLANVAVEERLLVGPQAELLALVVDKPLRGRGLGAALLSACEEWIAREGCGCLVIRSNTQRTAAHGFYLGRGCALVKEQKIFVKRCLPDVGAAR